MSVLVVVTDSKEGLAALRGAAQEANLFGVPLDIVNLTGSELDLLNVALPDSYTLVPPAADPDLGEVDLVLQALEERPEVSRLVVGVRKRSPLGKAVLGSIAQRLILDAQVPVLVFKTENA